MSAPALVVEPVPRPEWSAVLREGCRGVQSKLLLRDEALALALLRFEGGGTIDEHAADHEIDVVCLEGAGRTSVGGAEAALAAGERVRWPARIPHRLWSDGERLTTLMVERLR